MYGLIGRFSALEGRRDELIAAMLEASGDMPGCLSYIVARDPKDASAVWVTEVWDSRESHRKSLELPQVRETIARARPLIASFGEHHETEPAGGAGLLAG